ncbi:MAG: hypothetical protein LBG65_07600 [Puniceicoccales bacterium]|jgi:hypothetical protein|nr:hypothetical protein [Puniceicoccales bacterium]
MLQLPKKAKPGTLIAAAEWNNMVDYLRALTPASTPFGDGIMAEMTTSGTIYRQRRQTAKPQQRRADAAKTPVYLSPMLATPDEQGNPRWTVTSGVVNNGYVHINGQRIEWVDGTPEDWAQPITGSGNIYLRVTLESVSDGYPSDATAEVIFSSEEIDVSGTPHIGYHTLGAISKNEDGEWQVVSLNKNNLSVIVVGDIWDWWGF